MEMATDLLQRMIAKLPVLNLEAQVSGIFIVSVGFFCYIKTAKFARLLTMLCGTHLTLAEVLHFFACKIDRSFGVIGFLNFSPTHVLQS